MRQILKLNCTVGAALGELLPQNSKNSLRDFIQAGRVLVDGKRATAFSEPLKMGQVVEFVEKRVAHVEEISIVYEDPYFVVISKPEGLLSVATDFEEKNTAHAILKRRYRPNKVFVIHRLDRETSGLMVFARDERSYFLLKQELMAHGIERMYLGVVAGTLEGTGTWHSYLWEDKNYYVHASQDPTKGESATTHYSVLAAGKKMSLVQFRLETGKKNQIRVQASHAGHPILGDEKYHGPSAARLFLHAQKLLFTHPMTKKKLEFTSPLPQPFYTFVCQNFPDCL
jgi:tRNA pseudouridine32 synthase/23S rRNA pseudouridine746 synthase/23S rRNA pseudouridine1911/1915/1917 synthase